MSLAPKSPRRLRPLSVNPFADVRRTVREFDATTFAEYQETDRCTVDHSDRLEMDGDELLFLLDRGTKDVHIVPSDLPTDAQGHKSPFTHESVDSAGHGGLTARNSKPRPALTRWKT